MKLRGLLKGVVFGAMVSAAPSAYAAVWEDVNTWNADWENKYSEWVTTEFNPDYYTSRGPYGAISTDCADALYGARMIFSYENKLPFVVKDSWFKGKLLTNQMADFDDKGADKAKLMAFMKYVFTRTSANSLPHDTYPAAINRESIRPGVVWLTTGRENTRSDIYGPNHSEMVKHVSQSGVVTLMGSTMPAAVRTMKIVTEFNHRPNPESKTGLRHWKWPEQYYSNSPGLLESEEQYTYSNRKGNKGAKEYSASVRAALALTSESKESYMNRLAQNYCTIVKERVEIVHQAIRYQIDTGNQCMDERTYDELSTPSRDRSILNALQRLTSEESYFSGLTQGRLNKVAHYIERCGTFEVIPNLSIKYIDVARSYVDKRVSSDPNQSLDARWGYQKEVKRLCKK